MFFFSYIGEHISFESGKSIYVNDTPLTTLVSSPARYSSYTIYKAGLFVVINGTHFILKNKTTACLAQDACKVPSSKQKIALTELYKSEANSCAPNSGCC